MRPRSVATFLILALSLFFASATRAEEHPVIARLMMRDHVVTIASAPSGRLYSVSTEEGTVLEANLTEAELKEKYPDLYENVRPAVADGESGSNAIPWAGM